MVISYSAPPVRIKERPYLETFWNALGYGTIPFYLALLIFDAAISIQVHLLDLIPFLVSASGHILLQIRDISADKKANVTTTSTKHRKKIMIRLSKIFIGLAGFILLYLTVTGFLNYFAWISIIAGVGIALSHKKNVTKSYPILKVLYIIGELAFMVSLV